MREALAIAAVASLVVVPAAGAGATKGPTLRSLQAQITSLKKQVNALKKKVTLAQDIAIVSLDYGACSALEVVRAHNQNPPTTSVLAALLDLFKPTGASATSFMSVPPSTGYVFSQ